jgi:hypothetical protein
MNRVVLALLVATMASGGARDAAAQRPSDQVATDNEVFVDKQQLFADRDLMTDGTQVWLEDLVVRAKSGNVLKVGDHRHELFVVPADPSSLDFLTVGAHVDVRGTLRWTQSAGQARFTFAMSPAMARRFARQRVYVASAYVSTRS